MPTSPNSSQSPMSVDMDTRKTGESDIDMADVRKGSDGMDSARSSVSPTNEKAVSSTSGKNVGKKATTSAPTTSGKKSMFFKPGDKVRAKWRGNSCFYPGTVKQIGVPKHMLSDNSENAITGNSDNIDRRFALVDWDDGDSTDRVVEIATMELIGDDEGFAWSLKKIEEKTFVDELPFKGRCLFSKEAKVAGDTIFIEDAVLIATESKNKEMWQQLKDMHEKELPGGFSNGTSTFHFASMLSWLLLPNEKLAIIEDKFVPDDALDECPEEMFKICERWSKEIEEAKVKWERKGTLTPQLLSKLVNCWRYNSFGHHTEEGLVLYNRISMCAHSCDPTCCWTYGDGDSFVLRARQRLEKGSELTISYLQDEDLLKSIQVRRQKLVNWKFDCACERCMLVVDKSRGFRCLRCRSGAYYYKVDQARFERDENGETKKVEMNEDDEGKGVKDPSLVRFTNCDCCGNVCDENERTQCVTLEPDYITRIEGLDKTNLADMEIVYNATIDFFHETHWCCFVMDTLLWEYYKEKNLLVALMHQEKRIAFHQHAYKSPTFIWAWAMEEFGDKLGA